MIIFCAVAIVFFFSLKVFLFCLVIALQQKLIINGITTSARPVWQQNLESLDNRHILTLFEENINNVVNFCLFYRIAQVCTALEHALAN